MLLNGDLQLAGGYLINPRFENLAVDPVGTAGRVYFNQNVAGLRVYDGSVWANEGAISTALTIYVRAAGNDTTGDGSTSGTAYATINRAIQDLQGRCIDAAVLIDIKETASFAGFDLQGIPVGPNGSLTIEGNYTSFGGSGTVLNSQSTFANCNVILKDLYANTGAANAFVLNHGAVVQSDGIVEVDTSAVGILCENSRYTALTELRVGQTSSPTFGIQVDKNSVFTIQDNLQVRVPTDKTGIQVINGSCFYGEDDSTTITITHNGGITGWVGFWVNEFSSANIQQDLNFTGPGVANTVGFVVKRSRAFLLCDITISDVTNALDVQYGSYLEQSGDLSLTSIGAYGVKVSMGSYYRAGLGSLTVTTPGSMKMFYGYSASCIEVGISSTATIPFSSSGYFIQLDSSQGNFTFSGRVQGPGTLSSIFLYIINRASCSFSSLRVNQYDGFAHVAQQSTLTWGGQVIQNGSGTSSLPLFGHSRGGTSIYLTGGTGYQGPAGSNCTITISNSTVSAYSSFNFSPADGTFPGNVSHGNFAT